MYFDITYYDITYYNFLLLLYQVHFFVRLCAQKRRELVSKNYHYCHVDRAVYLGLQIFWQTIFKKQAKPTDLLLS